MLFGLMGSTRIPATAMRTFGVLLAVSTEGPVEIWCLTRQGEHVSTHVFFHAKAAEVAEV